MKKSLATGLVLSALLPMTAQAGSLELGIMADKQIGKSAFLTQAAATGSIYNGGGSYDAASPTGFGLRLAYNFLDLKVASLGAAVTYHPKVSSDLVLNGTTYGSFREQYNAVGLQADWKFLVNLHAGVEYRSEKLTTDQNATFGQFNQQTAPPVEASTTLTRPWATVGLGFSAPMPVVSPFVRLEVAAPLSKPANTGDSTDDFRKAMAPSLQVALYGGIRF